MRTILYLSYLGGLGGGETLLLSQLRAMERDAWMPRVICGTPGAFVDELRASNIDAQVMPYTLPYFQNGWLPRATLAFVPQLYRYVRQQRVDLIHVKDPHSAYYAAPVARLLHLPLVWTCTGWWHAERGWKSIFYEHFITRILTQTQFIRAKLIETNPRLRAKTICIPTGVDVNEFAPLPRDDSVRDELRIPRAAPLVILLARFQPVKGHEFFLDAALEILARVPETFFLIVGDNAFATDEAENYKREILTRLANDERLRARVVCAGFRRDIPRLLNASDVLVCPSLFETYGMANLEAMACGVPVVSTNVGGPTETVVDGETGFWVPPRDAHAIAARVCELLTNRELRAQMGARGRQRVVEHFALTTSVARTEQVYRELLESQT